MKKGIISILGIFALVLMFTGCGGSDGGDVSAPADTTSGVDADDVDTGDVDDTPVTIPKNNEYGISSELGTPPQLPAS